MDKESERYISRLFEQAGRKLRNIVARGVVDLADDSRKMQENQVRLLEGELISNAERAQQYGFSSHPLPGAECFVVFCGAAREHPVILAVDDRRYRVKDSKPGEVVIYTDEGDTITLKRGNVIEVAGKGDVIVKAGRTVSVEAGTSVAITADAAITLTAPTIILNGNLSATSSGSANFNAGTFTINADRVSINEGSTQDVGHA